MLFWITVEIFVPTVTDLRYIFQKNLLPRNQMRFPLLPIYHSPKNPLNSLHAHLLFDTGGVEGGCVSSPATACPTLSYVSSCHPDFQTSVRTEGRICENLPSPPADPTDVIQQN